MWRSFTFSFQLLVSICVDELSTSEVEGIAARFFFFFLWAIFSTTTAPATHANSIGDAVSVACGSATRSCVVLLTG